MELLNDQNTENDKMPELTNEEKKIIKTVRILENSNLNRIPDEAFHDWSSLMVQILQPLDRMLLMVVNHIIFSKYFNWCDNHKRDMLFELASSV